VLGGEAVDDCAGVVGGAVVDSDEVQGAEVEGGVVLLEKRAQACAYVFFFVAGGDDDCYRGMVGWGSIVCGCGEVWIRKVRDAAKADGRGESLPYPQKCDKPG
jgi:hypothetical protein